MAAGALLLLLGCSGSPSANAMADDGTANARIPWTDVPWSAAPEPVDNVSSIAKVELGKLLFHDPILSGDHATACVTCHSQYWGMGDGLVLGIGVGGTGPSGIGRRGPTTTRRNVPSLWNVAYRRALFWDGREGSLEKQVEVPLFDSRELGADPAVVMSEVAVSATYRALFADAFPESPEVSKENVARAIASFVRTIVTIDAPYDRYARGDDRALSPAELRGMHLFGAAGCATCHAPPMFGADRFDAILDGADAPLAPNEDLGRFEVTGDERDRRAFRVSQLRNVRETGPYFHDGRAATMKEAVRAMAEATSARPLADDELADIVEFIGKGLMDKAHVPERPTSVPSGLPVPVDGFTIRR